jgi:hypothetical protein
MGEPTIVAYIGCLGERFSMHKNYGGMGFKDLTTFNLAILGKQGWNFQTELNYLDSRIFKARYSPLVVSYQPIWDTNPRYVLRSFLRQLVDIWPCDHN